MVREALQTVRAPVRAERSPLTEPERALLAEGGFDARRPRGAPSSVRVAAEYAALLGDALTAGEAARRLGVDESRIRQRLGEGSLYGVKLRGGWRLPRFQFGRKGIVPGIDVVLMRAPRDLHPIELYTWLSTPDVDLELAGRAVSPLEWLKTGGDPRRAADLAADL
jgi:hypothetical protein